jgi:Fic family protein
MVPEYPRIQDLPLDFRSDEAESAQSLGEVWHERHAKLQGTPQLKEFNERLYRAWAIETGILERIYSIDVGTTLVLIERGLNAALIPNEATDQPPERVVEILEGHRSAIEAILDQISQHRGLTNHFICALHQKITETQHEVEGIDQFGSRTKTPLLRGLWKQQPNNPTRPDETLHPYCPPILVQDEMDRLVAHYADLRKRETNPIIRSAWLHHRFTQIHPFQDGNGRVARALVAFVLIEAGMFPIVVSREDRESRYLPALESADGGELHPLVTLFSEYEKQEITSALSIIEDLPPRPLSLDAILSSARERLVERQQTLQNKQRQVLIAANDIFDAAVQRISNLVDRLNDEVLTDGRKADFQTATQDTTFWFRWQIGEVASQCRYFADMDVYHQWLRLRIKEQPMGHAEAAGHAELVISVHALGRPFAGVMAVNGYFAKREPGEDGRSDTGPPMPLTKAPFSFAYTENKPDIQRRFQNWLDEVLAVGLEEWRRQL